MEKKRQEASELMKDWSDKSVVVGDSGDGLVQNETKRLQGDGQG